MKDFFIPTEKNGYRPRLLSRFALYTYLVVILFVNLGINYLIPVSVKAELNINYIYDYQNDERAKRGLPDLLINTKLVESANTKAKAMLESNCWSHYCPDGKSPWDFFDNAGYSYIYAGENLAEGFISTEKLMEAWMNSPTHRVNIVNTNFTEVGIGYAEGNFQNNSNNMIIVVHFGSRVDFTPSINLPDTGSIDTNLVKFTYPTDGISTKLNTFDILGTSPENSIIAINLNGSYFKELTSMGKVFKYPIATPLVDGDYIIYAEAYDKDNTFLGSSRNINFRIDTVSPIIDESGIEVTEVLVEDNSRSAIINYNDTDAYEIQDVQTGRISYRNASGYFALQIYENDIKGNEATSFKISDKAGNNAELDIPVEVIISMMDDLQSPLLHQLKDNIENLSSNQNIRLSVNWGFASFLTIIFGIDFLFLTKTGLSNSHRSKSHINLILYIILLLILIIGITSGNILNGSMK